MQSTARDRPCPAPGALRPPDRAAGGLGEAGGDAHGRGRHLRQRALAAASLRRRRGRGPQAHVREPADRDPKTGELAPMLAERWQVLDGGRTWKFHLRKGVRFHDGRAHRRGRRFTFTTIAKEGSANSLAPEFRLIKSMEVENPHTLTVRFEKPFVTFGNKVNQGLFASCAFIQSKKHVETVGEQGAERQPVGTGPWKFVEHVRGDRIVYEAVENHWRATPHWKRLVFTQGAGAGHPHGHAARGQRRRHRDRRRVRRRAEEGRRADDHHAERLLGVHHPRRAVADEADLRPQGAVGAARRRARAEGAPRPQPRGGQAGHHAAGARRARHRARVLARLPDRPVERPTR